MLEMNKEYTYKEICETLGWQIYTGGNAKKKQIECIENSYKYSHPLTTRKTEKKSVWIFTEKLSEPVIDDKRVNNGGKNSRQPEEEFDYLLNCLLVNGYNRNVYYGREEKSIYLANALIYREFGFDYYKLMGSINYLVWEKDNKYKVQNLFEDIVQQAVKGKTITRISRKLGYKKNSLPKGILRDRGSRGKRKEQPIADDRLLPMYEEIEKIVCEKYGCSDLAESRRKGKYNNIIADIEEWFEKQEGIYGIKKVNKIVIDEVPDFKSVKKIQREYQAHFYEIVMESIEKSIMNRINNSKEYKKPLKEWEKEALLYYWKQLAGEEAVPVERPLQVPDPEFEALLAGED